MVLMSKCAECQGDLSGSVTTVSDGRLLHSDFCALLFNSRRDQLLQKQRGVRLIETWEAKQFQDERGVIYHAKVCACPECKALTTHNEPPPVEGEELEELG